MTNSLALPDTAALRVMSVDDLRAELGRALEITAAHLARLAIIWRELEHRGEDLSNLRSGLWAYMPLIAAGRLRTELVVRYAGHSMLLRRLAELSDAEQGRILEEDTVCLVEHMGDGSFIERRVPIAHLKAVQIGQVLGGGRVRPPNEQRKAAVTNSRRSSISGKGRSPAQAGVIALAMQPMRRGDSDGRLSVVLPLTARERKALESRAASAGVPVSRLVRATLLQAGLLSENPEP